MPPARRKRVGWMDLRMYQSKPHGRESVEGDRPEKDSAYGGELVPNR